MIITVLSEDYLASITREVVCVVPTIKYCYKVTYNGLLAFVALYIPSSNIVFLA